MKQFILICTALLFIYSCGDDEPSIIDRVFGDCKGEKNNYDADLLATYSYPTNGQPTLDLDLNNSSSEINVQVTPTTTDSVGRIYFNFSGVTFKEDKKVFRIDDILTERKNSEGCWIVDNENVLSYSFSKSLDIVLVLDVSSSLNQNIGTIKESAVNMVTNILNDNPNARISVLKFSRGSVNTNFSSSISVLTQFINTETTFNSPDIGTYTLEGRSETALYESINTAVDLLNNSIANGKGILTFTDGVSNFQFDAQFQNPDNVITSLQNAGVSSYTIGYEGNQNSVEKSILEDLAVNGDFSFPEDLDDLEEVFETFTNSVAAVYDLIYNTNNANLDEGVEYRFLFKTTKISG